MIFEIIDSLLNKVTSKIRAYNSKIILGVGCISYFRGNTVYPFFLIENLFVLFLIILSKKKKFLSCKKINFNDEVWVNKIKFCKQDDVLVSEMEFCLNKKFIRRN